MLSSPSRFIAGKLTLSIEGLTDPADEALVLALTCEADGIKGTYTVPYGPGIGALDAEMVRRLPAKL